MSRRTWILIALAIVLYMNVDRAMREHPNPAVAQSRNYLEGLMWWFKNHAAIGRIWPLA